MGQCPKCGTKTSPEHSFCLNCGTVLDKASEPGAQESSALTSRLPPPGPAAAPAARAGSDAARARPPKRATQDLAIPMVVALVLSLLLQQGINSVVPPRRISIASSARRAVGS
jgi:uncharacterized OB-fold protein